MKTSFSVPGALLGFSLGGLFDGIVFHQMLGWHHMICRTETCLVDSVAALTRQNSEDGVFHFAMWILTVAGVYALTTSRVQLPRRTILGALLLGWGAFNFFEGLIDHEILGIHHVYPRSIHYVAFDLVFLASGIVAMGIGYALQRSVDSAQPLAA